MSVHGLSISITVRWESAILGEADWLRRELRMEVFHIAIEIVVGLCRIVNGDSLS